MKCRNHSFLMVMICILAVNLLTGVKSLASEPKSPPLSPEDKKKLETVKKMFDSDDTEADYYRTDRLLVSATGSQVPVHKAPSVASIITADEIESMGATSLDEILQTVPGLHVYPSGVNIFSSNWAIRGIHSGINPQALLLINGIPMMVPYNGARQQGFRLPVSIISRVEVIRGPGSAVHGADAFSGVINVITKDNFEIDGTQVGARYGSFDTYDVWLQHGGEYNGWDIWAGIENHQSDGDHDRIIQQDYMDALGLSAFSNTPGYLDTSYNVTTAHLGVRKENITLQFFGTFIDSAMGPGGLQAVTYGNDIDATDFMADLTWRDKNFTTDWDLSLRLSYLYIKGDNYFELLPSNFRNMIGNPIVSNHDGGIEMTAFYEGFNHHRIRFSTGMNYYDTNTEQFKNFGPGVSVQFGPLVDVSDTPFVFMEDQSRHLWFASVQDEWHMTSKLTFTGGVRLDDYSDFGITINPRAALVWEQSYWLTTKLLYGRAFRPPSFSEQYVQNNPVIAGNPDVEPETINTYELAFDLQPTKELHSVFSFFFYEAEDILEVVDEGSGAIPKTQNVGEQEGYGFEVEVEWTPVENFKLRSYFAYQDSENKKTGVEVHDVPQMQFYINPHWAFYEDWSLDAQYYWIGEMHRAQNDPRDEIDDFGVVNMTLRRKNILPQMDLAVAVRNLLDEDGRTPSPYDSAAPQGSYIPDDYPIEGRSLWVELRYKF